MTNADAAINQKIFETTIDLILVVDRNGTFIRVSPSSEAIIGYRPDEMVGKNATDFVYPPDLDNTREEMRAARRGLGTSHFDCRYVHKDGSLVLLNWTGIWSEEEGQHFFIGRDVTLDRATTQLARLQDVLANIDSRIAKTGKWTRFFRASDVRAVEVAVACNSLWASVVLAIPPSNFAAFPKAFSIAERLGRGESFWSAFAAISALNGVAGMIVLGCYYRSWLGVLLRATGLSMAGLFWCLMGVGTIVGNPDTLFGFGAVLIGLAAWWSLIRSVY